MIQRTRHFISAIDAQHGDDYMNDNPEERNTPVDPGTGNTISSRVGRTESEAFHEWLHAPVLDIDFPVWCVPSSTPGHFHLFVDKVMTWPEYESLLLALADCGIIEKGYAKASIERQATFVREPEVVKPDAPPIAYSEAARRLIEARAIVRHDEPEPF